MAKGKKAPPAPAKGSDADRLARAEEAIRFLAGHAGRTTEVEQVLEGARLEPEEE